VRGHKAALKFDSAPGGHRPASKVLFPADRASTPAPKAPAPRHSSAVVLVVDDKAVARRTAKTMLERFGYHSAATRTPRRTRRVT
jgi:hypothetical protein